MARLTELPNWMRECAKCADLVGRLVGAIKDHPIREFRAVQSHLVADHLALLPSYVDGCSTCTEWRGLVASRLEALPRGTVVELGSEELLHRAGHLVAAE